MKRYTTRFEKCGERKRRALRRALAGNAKSVTRPQRALRRRSSRANGRRFTSSSIRVYPHRGDSASVLAANDQAGLADTTVRSVSDPWGAGSGASPLSIEEIRELLAVDRNHPPVDWGTGDTEESKINSVARADDNPSEDTISQGPNWLNPDLLKPAMNAETRDRSAALFTNDAAFDPFAESLRQPVSTPRRPTLWSSLTALLSRFALPLMALALYFSALPLLRDIVKVASNGGQSLWRTTGNWLHIGNASSAEMAGLAYWWIFLPMLVVGWRYVCVRRAEANR